MVSTDPTPLASVGTCTHMHIYTLTGMSIIKNELQSFQRKEILLVFGGLDELPGLIYLNASFSVIGTVWEELRVVHYWRRCFTGAGFQASKAHTVVIFCL